MATRYQDDPALWAKEQAAALRAGRWQDLDLENLVEEIEGLSRSDRRELMSRMVALLAHLIKWAHQPFNRSSSWEQSIKLQREEIAELLAEVPSLERTFTKDWQQKAWAKARRVAAIETGLDEKTFPRACPWSADRVLKEDYFP
jgi:hypothetical protein